MSFENKGTIAATVKVTQEPDRSGNFVCGATAQDVEIQQAIDYLDDIIPINKGGAIVFGKGNYTDITTKLLLKDYLLFYGLGSQTLSTGATVPRSASVILGLATGVDDYMFGGADAANAGIAFENMGFYGNGSNQTAGGIMFSDASNILRDIYFKNCYFKEVYQSALRFDHGYFEATNCAFEGKQDNQAGLINLRINSSDCLITACEILAGVSAAGNLNSGIWISNSSGHVQIIGGMIYTSDYCIFLSDAHRVDITNNRIDNADRTNLYITDCTGIVATANNIYNANDGNWVDGYGVHVRNSQDCIIAHNTIKDTTGQMRYGIYEEGTSDDNILYPNAIRGWVTAAALITGKNTVIGKKYLDYIGYSGTLGPTVTPPIGRPVTSDETVFYAGDLPPLIEVQRIRVGGVALGGPIGGGGQMHMEFTLNAGARNVAYNTAAKSWNLPNHDGEEADYVANDGVSWIIDDTDVANEILALVGDDTVELHCIFEDGADPDGASNVILRDVWVEYV